MRHHSLLWIFDNVSDDPWIMRQDTLTPAAPLPISCSEARFICSESSSVCPQLTHCKTIEADKEEEVWSVFGGVSEAQSEEWS